MGRWNRETQCRPRCYWQQFDEWEHRLLGLWSLVQAGEVTDAKAKRCRFWVDPDLFRECREGHHPAFDQPFLEAWEVLAAVKTIAAELNDNHAAQAQIVDGRR